MDAARKLAERKNLTVEEVVARMVDQAVRRDVEWEQRVQRGRQVSVERFREILAKAPDVEPDLPSDRIE